MRSPETSIPHINQRLMPRSRGAFCVRIPALEALWKHAEQVQNCGSGATHAIPVDQAQPHVEPRCPAKIARQIPDTVASRTPEKRTGILQRFKSLKLTVGNHPVAPERHLRAQAN
jgi:hypothetical protein